MQGWRWSTRYGGAKLCSCTEILCLGRCRARTNLPGLSQACRQGDPLETFTAASPASSSLPALPCVSRVRRCRAVPIHRAVAGQWGRCCSGGTLLQTGSVQGPALPSHHLCHTWGCKASKGPPRDACAAHAGLAAVPCLAETGSCVCRKCFCRGMLERNEAAGAAEQRDSVPAGVRAGPETCRNWAIASCCIIRCLIAEQSWEGGLCRKR